MAGGSPHEELNNPLTIIHGRAKGILRMVKEEQLDPTKVLVLLRAFSIPLIGSQVSSSLSGVFLDGTTDPFLSHAVCVMVLRRGSLPRALPISRNPG